MADYYPLVARAVTMLDKGTGEARRALYERARNALVAQLRSLNPPLTESEITRERLSLEEAIRKVETEAARRTREKPRTDPADTKPAEPPREEKSSKPGPAPSLSPAPVELKIPAETPTREPSAPTQKREPSGPPPEPLNLDERAPALDKPPQTAAPAPRGATQSDRPRPPAANGRSTTPEQGLKGFRDVVADAETLGKASFQASKNAREAYAAVPGEFTFERMEPRVEPQGLRPPNRDTPPRPTPPRDNNRDNNNNRGNNEDRPPIPRAYYQQPRGRDAEHTQRSRRGLIVAVSTIVILVGVALTAYWQRDRISGLFGATRTAIQTPARDPNAARPKLTDRVGQPQDRARTEPPAAPQNVAPVAQRVVLYEEDPADSAGKRYVGSAIWRTEMVAPSPGAAPEMVVKAEMEIPERRLGMTISIRRNRDQSLPASHTVEIMFNLPPDFPFGGINNVPGLLMKQAEQTRGAPLSGLAVKVTSNFFLVGLSAVEAEVKRNIQLLKERVWLDIPVIYNNGRRAIIAIEKGTPGERAFNEAFAAWGQ